MPVVEVDLDFLAGFEGLGDRQHRPPVTRERNCPTALVATLAKGQVLPGVI